MNTLFDLHPVASLTQLRRYPVQEREGDQERHGQIVFKADMNACSLRGIDPQNRTAWRSGIRSISRLLPTPLLGQPQQLKNKIRIKLSQVNIELHLCHCLEKRIRKKYI